jgi:hypothetical protein
MLSRWWPTAEEKSFRRARELRLERSHLPVFPLIWTLKHVLDEQSSLYGCDASQAIATGARIFATLEARDPTLATIVHEVRSYAPEEIRFGMRHVDAMSIDEDGTPMADLAKIGVLEPALGERTELGRTEREEVQK